MVADNGSNYKAAGRLLCEKYPSISWSPCASHCINLILKDIGEMPIVVGLVNRGQMSQYLLIIINDVSIG